MTKIFNLSLTSNPIPGPTFVWSRDKDGKSTGRHTFTVVRSAMGLPFNQARFKKGTPITSLDPTLPAFFSFLKVEEMEASDLPGGYSEVSVTLSGFTEDGEFETDREISYSSNNVCTERSILQCPNFIEDVPNPTQRSNFARLLDGSFTYEVVGTGEGEEATLESVKVINPRNDEQVDIWTDEISLRWFEVIFIKAHNTFMAPTFDWGKRTANQGGISDSELSYLGKIDPTPGGSPPEPVGGEDYTWLKLSASDERGESSASTDEGWQWGIWPELIYEKRA